MNQDKEHLRLLAIFHYIVAGLAALFSFFPLLYATIGAIVRGAIGLRIAPEIERQGLDINQHGEEGYITS